jgi:hypothetical protein
MSASSTKIYSRSSPNGAAVALLAKLDLLDNIIWPTLGTFLREVLLAGRNGGVTLVEIVILRLDVVGEATESVLGGELIRDKDSTGFRDKGEFGC